MTKMNILKTAVAPILAVPLGFLAYWAFMGSGNDEEVKNMKTIEYFEERIGFNDSDDKDDDFFARVEFNEYTSQIYVESYEAIRDEDWNHIETKNEEFYIQVPIAYMTQYFTDSTLRDQLKASSAFWVVSDDVDWEAGEVNEQFGYIGYGTAPIVDEPDYFKDLAKTMVPTLALGVFFLWAWPIVNRTVDPKQFDPRDLNEAKITKSNPKREYNTILGQSTVKTNTKSFLDIFLNPETYDTAKVSLPNALFISSADDFRKDEFIEVIASEVKGTLYKISASDIAMQSSDKVIKTLDGLFSKTKHGTNVIHIDRIESLFNSNLMEQKVYDSLKAHIDKATSNRKVIVILSSTSDDIQTNEQYDKLNIAGYLNIPELSPKDREAIFKAALKDARVSKTIDYEELSEATIGFNDEKINRIVNQSLLRSVSNGNGILKMSDITNVLKTTK